MKFSLFTFLILLLFEVSTSLATGEDHFTLVSPEDKTYRNWTFSEMASQVQSDQKYLSAFFCDGKKENQIFFSPFPKNNKKDSLRIRLIKGSDATVVYTEGKIVADPQIPIKDYPFLQAIYSALLELEKITIARQLLRELETARFRIVIEPGGNRFSPTEEGGRKLFGIQMAQAIRYLSGLRKETAMPFYRLGSGGFVYINIKNDLEFFESDRAKRSSPLFVTLVHELFHAYDGVRGLFDQRLVKSSDLEIAAVSEYRACYFENLIRKESGRKFRAYYGDQEQGPGILDPAGNPILISAPCIRGSPLLKVKTFLKHSLLHKNKAPPGSPVSSQLKTVK